MSTDTPNSPTPTTPASLPGSAERLAGLFPDAPGGRRPWWRRRGPVAAVAAAVVVAVIAGVLVATRAAGADSGGAYRTATAGVHDVDTVLTGVATIEPVSQAAVAFPVAGTVETVPVSVGDEVTLGQTLATLDTASLQDTLHQKEQSLADAQLVLTKALAGEDVSSLTGRSKGTPNGSSATGAVVQPASVTSGSTSSGSAVRAVYTSASVTTAAPAATGGVSDAELAAARQAVVDAQKQVDAAMAAASTALATAETVCASSGSTSATADSTTTTAAPDGAACQAALAAVMTAQKAVQDAQTALASASSAYDDLLQQRAASGSGGTPSTPSTPTPSASPPSGSLPSGGSTSGQSLPSGTTGGTITNTASSADLVAYQKAVDAAGLEVVVAQQAVAQATIVSPIAGTVAAVGVAVGDTVSAASSTDVITVVGKGGLEASTLVSVDDIQDVKVGQVAVVVPDGTAGERAGKVVAVSVAADTSGSTTNYRVVIGLTDGGADLHLGQTGTVAIVTDRATSALAVPTSAISTRGSRHTVTVLADDGTTSRVEVGVGVVGDTWTEITKGISKGTTVVLADLDEALPGSATSSSSSSGNGGTTSNGGTAGIPGGGGFPGAPPSFTRGN